MDAANILTTQIKYRETKWTRATARARQTRWLLTASLLLGAVVLAILRPGLGARAGILRSEYSSYIPLVYIYMSAGYHVRAARFLAVCRKPRALIYAHTHLFLISPLLVAGVVGIFKACGTDQRLLKGAAVWCAGGSRGWLGAALARGSRHEPHAVIAALSSALLAALLTPLHLLLACACTSPRPLHTSLSTALGVLAALSVGATLRWCIPGDNLPLLRPKANNQLRPEGEHWSPSSIVAALLLVYVECCDSLKDADAQHSVEDVLVTVLLVCSCVLCCAAVCCVTAHYLRLTPASLALCSLHNEGARGWEIAVCCGGVGLSRLPGVLFAPAQATVLVALMAHYDRHDDADEGYVIMA